MLIIKEGCLFDFYHQVYVVGASNKGYLHPEISSFFEEFYPEMHAQFNVSCEQSAMEAGTCFFYLSEDTALPHVFIMILQDHPLGLNLNDFEKAVEYIFIMCSKHSVTDIGMTLLGTIVGKANTEALLYPLNPLICSSFRHVCLYESGCNNDNNGYL